jgi:hypothetical protein
MDLCSRSNTFCQILGSLVVPAYEPSLLQFETQSIDGITTRGLHMAENVRVK